MLVYWKHGDRLMVMTPELGTRSNGEQVKDSVRESSPTPCCLTFPSSHGSSNNPLWTWTACCSALPLVVWDSVVERWPGQSSPPRPSPRTPWCFDVPNRSDGNCWSVLSIVDLPRNNGYKPREADNRIGYFMTSYRDLGDYSKKPNGSRYILDTQSGPQLEVSPPKEPIITTSSTRFQSVPPLTSRASSIGTTRLPKGIDNAIRCASSKQTGGPWTKIKKTFGTALFAGSTMTCRRLLDLHGPTL